MSQPVQVIVRTTARMTLLMAFLVFNVTGDVRSSDTEIVGYSQPNWSPDGHSLAFVAEACTVSGTERACNQEIYRMDADGSHPMNVTQSPDVNERSPRWSPQGEHIAYTGENADGSDRIYAMKADGTVVVALGTFPSRLLNNPATGGAFDWSPDGEQVVMVSASDGYAHLYTVNGDGSQQIRLTEDPTDHYSPVWSPDGKQIAFVSTLNGQSDIFLIDPDGTGLTNLTDTPDDTEVLPAWSPDGSRIAFSRYPALGGSWELAIVNADGSDLTVLSENVAGIYPPRLRWSPDGRQIAFAVATGMMSHILILSADGQSSVYLTEGMQARNGTPDWSPDGTQIAFWSDLGLRDNLYLIHPDGTNRIQLTGDQP